MLKKRPFETAEILLYDPVAANRNATRASLFSVGFKNVELAPSIEVLEKTLRERSPDVLFVEVAGAEAEVCRLIQSVRQGTAGNNPFIVIMVTTWRRDGTIVGLVVNSGADDLLARPFSIGLLGDRIRAQIERRKDFVVTSDYIGPDRRRADSRPGVECFAAPNALKIKATEGVSEEEALLRIAESVEKGKTRLNAEKLRRDAAALAIQWRFLEQRGPEASDYGDILARMGALAGEIKRRVSAGAVSAGDARARASVQWCDVVQDSVGGVQSAAGKAAEMAAPLERLGHAALSVAKMFGAEEGKSDSVVELDALPRREAKRATA